MLLFGAWLGAPGVLIGQAVGGVIFGVLAWWLAYRVIDRAQLEPVPQQGPFQRQSRLMALLHARR